MGTLSWTVCKARPNPNTYGATEKASGSYTSSTSAGTVTSLSPNDGDAVRLHADEAMWVRFGGRTAAVGTGFFIPASGVLDVVVDAASQGAVSAIDVA
jgi:hypothetical protein